MRLRLHKLQAEDEQDWKAEAEHSKGWNNIDGVLHYQGLPYISETIWTELMSRHHNNPLASHFGIKKIRELVAQKYYWPTLRRNVEDNVKGCDIWLASKIVRHKPYGDLQFLSVPTHCWKYLLIDFVTGLPISTMWKENSNNSILVIVNWLTKIVYYKPVKVIIDAPSLA